jgi:hypothetical protein
VIRGDGKGVAGLSDGMPSAFETTHACKRGCALQGRRGGGLMPATRSNAARKPEARLNRVRSAFTQQVMGFVCGNLNVHMELQAEESGQLLDLGSVGV